MRDDLQNLAPQDSKKRSNVHRLNYAGQQFFSIMQKVLLCVYRMIINYSNYLKNLMSLVQFTGESIKMHFMWLTISC